MQLRSWRHFDFLLFGAMIVLIVFGIAMIDSAVAGNPELIEAQAVERQILFAVFGLGVIFITTLLDYHLWITISRVMFVVIIFFLGLVAFGGETAFGAQRWLDVGFALIQPSELAKLTAILLLADYFQRNKAGAGTLGWVFRSFLVVFFLTILILLQPNLSTSIVIYVIWAALLFASGLSVRQMIVFGILALVLAAVAFPFLEEYQQQRVIQFAFPDPEARFGTSYNVTQALVTIGSGGWFGLGYGQGPQVQLRFLKVRHSDFIFAATAHEFGLVGTLLMLAVLFFLIWRVLRAARLAHDMFGALVCYGVATWILFQTLVNIGMNLNLMPVTGLPLPFISHGGSSLLSLMLSIGLVESVVARHKMLEF
ncbi:MAG: rod shape-determining protein RodA [Anaerolineae bacterium]|nr:MAG: rod shape-determining protein RodA [Anaerolineae bacterium]